MEHLLTNMPEPLKELKAIPHWVAWHYNEERKKIPTNPHTGKNASPSNPATWTDFDTAAAFDERMGYTANHTGGIGFMFGVEPSGLVGIDIDHCILPDGKLSDMAADIVNIMDSYTERSVSGTGLHILFRLDKPLSEIGDRNRDDSIGLEIYDQRRYFVITGNVYGQARPIADRTEELTAVYEKYMPKAEEGVKSMPTRDTPTVDNKQKSAMTVQESRRSEDLSDDALWQRMFASAHGREIKALYYGDCSMFTVTHEDGTIHEDHSAADLALCSYLAWWTHNDEGRINRMFRQSDLMRDKWNRDDYRGWTLSCAMNNDYSPLESTVKSGHVRERRSSVMVEEHAERQLTTVGGDDDMDAEQIGKGTESRLPLTGFDYVESGIFARELEQFQKFPPVKSGFTNLDTAQGDGFLPGFIMLGAVPSLGKTSFLSQVSDNMAKAGNSILFFSLEQSVLEMTTKSISRLTAQFDKRNAVSAINVRRGKYINDVQRKLVDKAIERYKEFAQNISIIQGTFDMKVSDVVKTVGTFIEHTGLRPIVFIDYLQLLLPDSNKITGGKDSVEYAIRRLKAFQMENNLIMFAVSSFNRQSYTTSVGYDSFKETGLSEYSCDVMLGLQPSAMLNELFTNEKANRKQRDACDKAINTIPRRVMVKNLKTRYGRRGYSCGFVYDPRFDLFEVDEDFREGNGHDGTAIL